MKWRRTARELEKRKSKRHKIERERMKNRLLDRAKSGFTLMPYNQTTVGAEADWNAGMPRLGLGKITETGEMIERGPGVDTEEDVKRVMSDESMDLGPLTPMKYE